jgi:hypothetical protein
MQNPSYPVDNSSKKIKAAPSWRERNRLNLQTAALGMGVLALLVLLFCVENNQTLFMGIGFALVGVVFNISVWA